MYPRPGTLVCLIGVKAIAHPASTINHYAKQRLYLTFIANLSVTHQNSTKYSSESVA